MAPNASLTVTIPQEAVQTRAAGDGSQVNRCILQVYRNGAEYGDQQVVAVNGSTATFTDLQLVASQTYQFVFWADCGTGTDDLEDNHYNTSDLTNITVNGDYIGNNEEFDAFFKCEELTVTDAFSHEVTLARPFGQLNVKTNDLDAIGEGHDDLKPTHVTVNFSAVPTTFNALTGETGSPVNLSYTAEVVDNAGHLTLDYIWAEEDQANLADFSMTFLNNSTEITTNDNFHNIPIRRNYQTTVSGNLLTKKGTINVNIAPDFAGDELEADVYEVSAGNLQTTLSGLSTTDVKAHKIVVTDNLAAITYNLPALPEGASLSIAMVGADGDVTFSGAEFKGMIELTNTSSSAMNVAIEVPQGDATLGAGNWGAVSAETKPGTFTIASDANVTKVTVEGGNVNVNKGAEVGKIVRGENNTDEETVVTLFDGATVTITNYEANTHAYVSVLAAFVQGSNTLFENCTVKNATINVSTKNVWYVSVAGLFAGHWGGNAKNCDVIDSTISVTTATDKILEGYTYEANYVGGLVGEGYAWMKNCDAKNVNVTYTLTDIRTAVGKFDSTDYTGQPTKADVPVNVYFGGAMASSTYLQGVTYSGNVTFNYTKAVGPTDIYFGGLSGLQRYGYIQNSLAKATMTFNNNNSATVAGQSFATGGILGGFDATMGLVGAMFGIQGDRITNSIDISTLTATGASVLASELKSVGSIPMDAIVKAIAPSMGVDLTNFTRADETLNYFGIFNSVRVSGTATTADVDGNVTVAAESDLHGEALKTTLGEGWNYTANELPTPKTVA